MVNNKYLKTYASFLKKHLKLKRPLKVIFDASNGSGALLFKAVATKNSRLSVTYINHRPDGNFPGHGPNPLADGACDELISRVRKLKADLGIALDNDGDRAFFVDETGRLLTSTEATIFMGENFSGTVVVDFVIGPLAYQYFKKLERKVFTSKVGLYFIKQAIAKHKATFAAEYSGHYYFKEINGSDCAVMAAIHFMNRLSRIGNQELGIRNLSDWLKTLPRYHQKVINFNYERERFPKLAGDFVSRFEKIAQKVSDLDGIKVEFADYWFNLRASNTEDLVRLTIESQDPILLDKKIEELRGLVL